MCRCYQELVLFFPPYSWHNLCFVDTLSETIKLLQNWKSPLQWWLQNWKSPLQGSCWHKNNCIIFHQVSVANFSYIPPSNDIYVSVYFTTSQTRIPFSKLTNKREVANLTLSTVYSLTLSPFTLCCTIYRTLNPKNHGNQLSQKQNNTKQTKKSLCLNDVLLFPLLPKPLSRSHTDQRSEVDLYFL